MQSCSSPIAYACSNCICFSCCSPFASASSCCSSIAVAPSASAAVPNRIRFGCCSPIASASAAAPRLRPLQLLLARLRPLRRLLLPDCMHPLACSQPSPSWIPAQCSRTFFTRFSKLRIVYEHPTSVTHKQTQTHTHTHAR